MIVLRLKKYKMKTILTTAILVMSYLFMTQPSLASDGRSKAIAMQIAEQQTQGKAVRAQYRETSNKAGFRVRLLKNGKVIHTFISMQRINGK